MLFQVVIIWWIVVNFGTTGATTFHDKESKTNVSEHLCGMVMSGRFENIELKSITFYDSDKVVIFEGDHHYVIETSKITSTTLEVPEKYYPWNKNLVKSQLDLKKVDLIKSEYSFKQEGYQKKFITTNEFRYAFHMNKRSFTKLWKAYTEMMNNETLPRGQPDYAIAHDQGKEDSWGYVIQKDMYQGTNNYVIYQLWVDGWSIKLQHPNESADQKKYFHQYHLERNNNAAQTVLVHSSRYDSSTRPNPRDQLFSSLPRGFVMHQQLYLFDTDLGCVYIIKQWNRPDLAKLHRDSADNIIKDRVNVPYEKFFKCPEQYALSDNNLKHKFTHSENRCETTNKLIKTHWIVYISGGAICVLSIMVAIVFVGRLFCDGPGKSFSKYNTAASPPCIQKSSLNNTTKGNILDSTNNDGSSLKVMHTGSDKSVSTSS